MHATNTLPFRDLEDLFESRQDAVDLDRLDDDEIALALKSVAWTARDLHHFVRNRAAA